MDVPKIKGPKTFVIISQNVQEKRGIVRDASGLDELYTNLTKPATEIKDKNTQKNKKYSENEEN